MGNHLTKDFKQVQLGHGELTSANSGRNAMVPDAVVLDASVSIALKKDPKHKTLEFVDEISQKLLFVSSTIKGYTTTKDTNGNVLFAISAPNKATRIIYKTGKQLDSEPSEALSVEGEKLGMASIAKIEIDFVAASRTAFLSIKHQKRKSRTSDEDAASTTSQSVGSNVSKSRKGTKRSSEVSEVDDPSFADVYKAVKIPNVKYGVIIVDMNGQVVGKSAHEPKQPNPIIMVAPGADAAAVVALVCVLIGDL